MVLKSHIELTKRHRQKANDCNHAAALLAGTKFTPDKEPVDHTKFLPYPTDDGRMLSLTIRTIVDRLIKEDKLPAMMVADLYHKKLLPKPER
jgi:hypothetical protein